MGFYAKHQLEIELCNIDTWIFNTRHACLTRMN